MLQIYGNGLKLFNTTFYEFKNPSASLGDRFTHFFNF